MLLFIQDTPTVVCFPKCVLKYVADIKTHLASQRSNISKAVFLSAALLGIQRLSFWVTVVLPHTAIQFLFSFQPQKTLRAAGAIELRRPQKFSVSIPAAWEQRNPLKIMLRTQSRRPLLNRNRTVRKAPRRGAARRKSPPAMGSHWRSPLKLQTGSLWRGPGSDWLRWTAAGFNGKGKVLSGWVEKATDLYLRLVWKSKQWWKQVSLNNRGTPKRWNGQTPSVVVAHKPETLKRLWLILSVTG